MLFGAFNLRVTENGLECDNWLPIVGNVSALDDVERLKDVLDLSLLRVFEGLGVAISRGRERHAVQPKPDEHDDEEGEGEGEEEAMDLDDPTLSPGEVVELDNLAAGVVKVARTLSFLTQGRTDSLHARRFSTCALFLRFLAPRHALILLLATGSPKAEESRLALARGQRLPSHTAEEEATVAPLLLRKQDRSAPSRPASQRRALAARATLPSTLARHLRLAEEEDSDSEVEQEETGGVGSESSEEGRQLLHASKPFRVRFNANQHKRE